MNTTENKSHSEIIPPNYRDILTNNRQWEHKKTGNAYDVLIVTSEPDDPARASKYPVTVVYQGKDGRIWPRNLESWFTDMKPLSKP